MSSQVRLRLLPRARCLFDEPIKVKVEGLRSRQAVTMRARLTDEKGVVFSSSATYRADGSGEIDLNRDPSLGGTYVGVEPMGLMWSMTPDTMHKRFQETKSLEPQLVNFSVHEEEGRILAEETSERVLIGDGVSRVPVKEGNISGVLFTPPEKMSSQVRLTLLPRARCLFDEPIKVKVEGLRSRQVVTMRARLTDEKGVVFSSSATYRADGSGEIDLNRDPSLGGTYVGVEPMGLLWSMRPDTMHKKFKKIKSLEPQLVNFSVHEEEGRILAEETNERVLIGDGVSRVPVKEGNISGVLFTPPGEGLFPAVLDISTLRSETRASLLANKGFVVLYICVIETKLENMQKIHLDHFKEAMDFLKQQPKVGSKGVGIVARSKAADLALSLATFVPGVEAAVCINGFSANMGLPLYYKKKKILSPLGYDCSKLVPTESGASIGKYIYEDPLAEKNKGSLIPIERAKAHFLFVAGEDDLCWDSKAYMDEMVERLKRHGKENFESVSYPGAGHLLEPPYEPFCPSAAHGILRYLSSWGGEPKAHAAAEVHLWKKIQEFFRTHLSCDAGQTKAKL